MKITFVLTSPLERADGHYIRRLGIINSFAKRGNDIRVVVCGSCTPHLHRDITVDVLDYTFSENKRRLLQFFTALELSLLVNVFFGSYFRKLFSILNNDDADLYVFPEMLDNAVGNYVSKKKRNINCCIDNFGILSDEFTHDHGCGFAQKLMLSFKHKIAFKYETVMYSFPARIIFSSKAMRDHMAKKHPSILNKVNYVINDSWSDELVEYTASDSELNALRRKYGNFFFYFFCGEMKRISGVDMLLEAFSHVCELKKDVKLFVIGDGQLASHVYSQYEKSKFQSQIILIPRVTLRELKPLMKISHVIVCPERKNLLSDLMVHIKYYNSLCLNKPVLSSDSNALKEFNKDERYSVSFQAGSVDDLAKKMTRIYDCYDSYSEKYNSNFEKIRSLSYYENTKCLDMAT